MSARREASFTSYSAITTTVVSNLVAIRHMWRQAV
jgi:hypothetical protein